MSTYSEGLGPEEEDGGGWSGLVPSAEEKRQEKAEKSSSEIWNEAVREPAVETRLTAEQLAQKFHEAYERLAPQFSYETRKASAKPWGEVPENNRNLMIAVCDELLEAFRDKSEAEEVKRLNKAFDLKQLIAEQYATSYARLQREMEALQVVLPDTLGRSMAVRIEGLKERADREANLAVELRQRAEAAEAEAAALRERCETFVEHTCTGSALCRECAKALSAAPERGKDGKSDETITSVCEKCGELPAILCRACGDNEHVDANHR